jgi:hypothetical protein
MQPDPLPRPHAHHISACLSVKGLPQSRHLDHWEPAHRAAIRAGADEVRAPDLPRARHLHRRISRTRLGGPSLSSLAIGLHQVATRQWLLRLAPAA